MRRERPAVAARLLGQLELDVAGRVFGPRDMGGTKQKQLMELLLLERGRLVPKDRIADRLWGQDPPRSVSATIETYVSGLRRRLDEVVPGLGRRLIATEPRAYRLAADGVALDLDRFESLVRRASEAGAAARRQLLEQALDLADGELLADEPYADWLTAARAHYRALLFQSLVDLAECCLDLDDHRPAIRAAERARMLEPASERVCRVQMLAHYALGAPDEALRVFEQCRRSLADELGVDPAAETAALHVAILRGADPPGLPGDAGSSSRALPGRPRATLPISYADNGGVRIAYQVVGDGPVDLVFSPSFITNLGATWDDPTYAAFLRRLASMARLILFDKRGTGLSDPALDFPTQRERSEDLLGVLDAVGCDCPVLFGVCGGGGLCIQFAADHPDRTAGLILHNSAARILSAHDYPWGLPAELYQQFLASFEEIWLDESERIARRNPGLADNPRYRDWYAHYVRLASNPFMAKRLAEMNASIDNRALLPLIRSPCLVLTRTEDAWMSPENSRYLAAHIGNAELLELPGVDHDPWVGDYEPVLDAVRAFLSRRVSTQDRRVAQKT